MGAIVVQYSQNMFFFVFVRSASVAVVVAVLTLSGKGLRFRVRGLFSFLLIFQALITHRVALYVSNILLGYVIFFLDN